MTREEEITKRIFEVVALKEPNPHSFPFENLLYSAGYMDGAKWADEHPKQIEISLEDIEEFAKEVIPDDWVKRQDTLWEMIRRNQRAQFIDKACKWLKDYAHMFVSETTGDLDENSLINIFYKAMEGGEE